MTDRAAIFEREISDYDERQVPKVLDFKRHRFVTVERDSVTTASYIRGHKSLRGACSYLADVVEGCERFVPEKVLDLDTGEMHELDVFAFVAPKSVDAVAVLMPRSLAREVLRAIEPADQGPIPDALVAAHNLIEQALKRRSG